VLGCRGPTLDGLPGEVRMIALVALGAMLSLVLVAARSATAVSLCRAPRRLRERRARARR